MGNLILSTGGEFYYDDVTVTSFTNIAFEVVPSRNEQRASDIQKLVDRCDKIVWTILDDMLKNETLMFNI